MKRRGIAMFLALCLSLSLVSGGAAAAGNNPFADVPSSHWANEAVNYVYGKGMMNGVGKDTFQPKGSLTRAMFVTILGRMAGVKENAYPGTSFGDVPVGQWYSPYVAWAAQTGVTGGTGGGKFSPTSAVTREQMATMIARYTESADLTLGESSDPAPSFTDQSAVASWAREGVDLMRRTGILTGYEDGSFQPQRTANRAEAAAIFMRLDQSAGGSAQAAYTVTFDTNGGSAVPSQTVKHGQTVQKPADPTRPGKRFQGWQSKGTGKAYDFKAPVTGNLTLVAVWAEDMGEDTLYELTDDRVVIDPVEQIPYVKDILLAFVKPDLSEREKNQIAAQVGGTIAGEISGSINILQICVKEGTLAELEAMVNTLQKDQRVTYASCDYPVPAESITSAANVRTVSSDSGDWWYSAVRADEAWDKYRDCFGDVRVGVIDDGVEIQHQELSGSITFASPYYRAYNESLSEDAEMLNHGTHVSGIIAAKEDGRGTTGVAPQADLIFASYMPQNQPEWETPLSQIHALNCEIEKGAKVINCSFGLYYYDEAVFNEKKKAGEKGFQYETYQDFLSVSGRGARLWSMLVAAATCELICQDREFLVVQGAGNGINNRGPGIDAKNVSYWAGCSKEIVGDICQRYNIPYEQLDKRILVVGGVVNNKNENVYIMDTTWNYGDTVDICAPSRHINSSVCDEKGSKYAVYSGTSMATPIVTGAAALVWSVDPDLKAEQVRDILLENHQNTAQGVYVGRVYTYPMVDVYSAVRAAVGEKMRDLVGVYKGSYFANQGETGLTLKVYEENGDYRAQFDFYNLPGQTNSKEGSYTMDVTATKRGTFRFNADQWLEQPADYQLLDLEGTLRGDVLSGKSPISFTVTRVSQIPPEDVPPVIPDYDAFLEKKGYQDYLENWWCIPSEYALLDIDQDGTQELIIQGGELSGFYEYLIFRWDAAQGKPVSVPIDGSDQGFTSYGGVQYVPKYRAINAIYVRPSDYDGKIDYYVLKNSEMVKDFSIGWETPSVEKIYVWESGGGQRKIITQEQYEAYWSENQRIVFQPLP